MTNFLRLRIFSCTLSIQGIGMIMKADPSDRLFWMAITILSFLHVDFWAWEKIHPTLLGWIPYHLWYDGGLTILGALFFFWWGQKRWPNPPEDLEQGR